MYLEKAKQNTFIKPQAYESMKKRSFKNIISKRENMIYDEINDEYTCHNNKKLKVIGESTRRSKSGYEADVTLYECENCADCTYKLKCTKAKGNKKLSVSKKFVQKRLKSLENITSLQGTMLRMNRSIQVEGAFGVLKEDHGFRRFLLEERKM